MQEVFIKMAVKFDAKLDVFYVLLREILLVNDLCNERVSKEMLSHLLDFYFV